MGSTLPPDPDVWDLDRLRLPAEMVGDLSGRRRPPRHRPGDPFIKGPIPHAWIASACRLPGAGLPVAMAFRFLCGRFRSENRWGLDAISEGLQVSPDSARLGLHAAELAGLLSVAREPGLQAGGLRLGPPGAGGWSGPSASVRADPLGLVAPGLPAPREVTSGCVGLLAIGRMEPISRF
jgi:hypothetical protein